MPYRIGDDHIDLAGTSLECRWIGPPPDQAPTIVMLHEGIGCVALWRDFPDKLATATGCGVIAYSRRGYGHSDPIVRPRPLDFMHDEAENVLAKLLDAIGFRRGILLGHSDGASIATIYAGSVQDHRVRGVVLFAPHFFVEDLSIESIEAAKIRYQSGDLRPRLAKFHGNNVDGAFYGWNDVWLDPGFRDWSIENEIAHIRVPILIVQGAGDEYGTLAQLEAAREEAYCPVETVVLERSGHAPHIDRPEATLDAVSRFIARLMRDHAEAAPLRLATG